MGVDNRFRRAVGIIAVLVALVVPAVGAAQDPASAGESGEFAAPLVQNQAVPDYGFLPPGVTPADVTPIPFVPAPGEAPARQPVNYTIDAKQLQGAFDKAARLTFAVMVAVLLIGAVLTVFWVWMLIDVIARPLPNKTPWVLIVILLGALGAIIYFFAARRKHIRGQIPSAPEAAPSVPSAPAR